MAMTRIAPFMPLEDQLRDQLVGPNNRVLYRDSPQFQYLVEQMVRLVPVMLEPLDARDRNIVFNLLPRMMSGVADHARAHQDEVAKALERLLTDPQPKMALGYL